MNITRRILILLGAAALAIAVPALTLFGPSRADADDSLAPDFTLADVHQTKHTLSEYKGKYVVLEWLNFGCPFVRKHYGTQNMQTLQKKYTEKGVVWLAIVSSAPGKEGYYPPDELNAVAEKQSWAGSALLPDSDGKVGKLYGARTTPHMFVIDPTGKVIYKGAIDDKRTADPDDVKEAVNYVAAALDEAMSGKPVTTPATQPYGCSVKY